VKEPQTPVAPVKIVKLHYEWSIGCHMLKEPSDDGASFAIPRKFDQLFF
jgi:hypothetical protein